VLSKKEGQSKPPLSTKEKPAEKTKIPQMQPQVPKFGSSFLSTPKTAKMIPPKAVPKIVTADSKKKTKSGDTSSSAGYSSTLLLEYIIEQKAITLKHCTVVIHGCSMDGKESSKYHFEVWRRRRDHEMFYR
jgi:hypothetical protein